MRQALKEIGGLEQANVFVAADRKILDEDLRSVELGVEGKIAMDAPRRAPGSRPVEGSSSSSTATPGDDTIR